MNFLSILKKENFRPLFWAMGLGAFNDNFMRQALIALVAFGPFGLTTSEKSALGGLSTSLLIIPFFLFSSLAGELADKESKSLLLKITKGVEVVFSLLAAYFFISGSLWLLLGTLFLMGLQSTFFGPLKYGLLPEVLDEKALMAGNSLVGAFSFLAIVAGSVAGSFLATLKNGPNLYVPVVLSLTALLGFYYALKQPPSLKLAPNLKIDPLIFRSTLIILADLKTRPDLLLIILAVSWFWGMGSIVLIQVPIMAASLMGTTPNVSTTLVCLLALGLGLGALGANRLVKGETTASLTPISAFVLCLITLSLSLCLHNLPPAIPGSVGLVDFFSTPIYLASAILCFLISFTGGLFVTPLYALMQRLSEQTRRARVIAANNILNSLFMVVSGLAVALMVNTGLSLAFVFLLLSLSALFVSFAAALSVSKNSINSLVRLLLTILYRPKIKGLERLKELAPGPVMIIPNHTSFVDVAFLAVYIPLNLSFAIDLKWSKIWWVRIFTKLRRTIPVDSTNPLLARNLIDALKEGQAVVVFPEGRITSNGSLTKIYDGPGHIASRCGCPVIPVFFRGLEYTSFGRLKDTLKNRPKKNKVSMTVFGPIYLEKKPKEGESRPAFRERLNWEIYNILTKAKFESQEINLNVYQALLETAYLKGEGRRILEDIRRNPISYKTLIKQIKVLASYFRKTLPTDQYVGLICPNSTILAAAIFALWADSKVAVMLNYSQGLQPMLSAIKACDIKTVISLEAFIEQGKLSELVNTLPVETIYLDRLKLSFFEKLKGLFFKPSLAKPSEPAAVLFTSGFEGRPKGAVLSHSNLLSDIYQAVAIIGLNEDDVLFNSMPAFHAFGLNVGLILPLIYGLKGFVHPNPLKLKEIPELIYDTRSTVVIGSDTFAAAWGKNAHPYDFSNVNFMFLGAERLKPSTVDLYLNKLSLRVFEGYGVTEASPILAISNRMRSKKGSAGQFLPGVKWRLEPVEGLKEGGKLMVKGPNVMLGYLRAEKPKVIAPLKDGWHDTGDVAQVDNEGFLFIKGRAHRFAKISGEMISLAAIEEHSALLWPDNPTAVLSIVDPTRGEKLVLVYEKGFSPDLEALKKAIRQSGLSDLYIPKTTAEVEKIPLTPLGKVNAALLAETLQESLKEDRGGLKG